MMDILAWGYARGLVTVREDAKARSPYCLRRTGAGKLYNSFGIYGRCGKWHMVRLEFMYGTENDLAITYDGNDTDQ